MNAKFTPLNPTSRPTPTALHRRQMIWQVWLPLIVSIIIVLAVEALAIVGAANGSPLVDHWGAIAAILIIIPVLVVLLVILGFVGGMAYGVSRLLKPMPGWMLKAQLFMVRVALIVRRAADASTKPVVAASTFSARVSRLWNDIFHHKTR